jgi:hypothetical protein
MDYYSYHKCWEIMNCDNLDCPARSEPKMPCWEIARQVEAYHNLSNTCKDCVVYILKESTSVLRLKQLQNILLQKGNVKQYGPGHQPCL